MKNLLGFAVCMFVMTQCSLLLAAEQKFSVAARWGLATVVSHSLDAGSRFAVGASAETNVERWYLGVSFFRSSKQSNSPNLMGGMVNVQNSYLGLYGVYQLPLPVAGFSAGTIGGIAWQDGLVSNGAVINGNKDFFLGPCLRYDFFVSQAVSVGAEAEAAIAFSSPSTTLVHSLGALRYWF